MQDTAPSPAPSRSGPYYGPDATALATAAQLADADAASASEAEKSQDADTSEGSRVGGAEGKCDSRKIDGGHQTKTGVRSDEEAASGKAPR